jgi:hypothetical protein
MQYIFYFFIAFYLITSLAFSKQGGRFLLSEKIKQKSSREPLYSGSPLTKPGVRY